MSYKTSMASATGFRQTTADSSDRPDPVEHRLLVSYLLIFALTFSLAAFLVRSAFVASLEQQETTRLEVLARAGLRTAVFHRDRLAIDPNDISNKGLMLSDQGLQWFDKQRHLLGSQGLAPDMPLIVEGKHQLTVGKQTFDTTTIPILIPNTQHRVGTVRASEVNVIQRTSIRWFDLGLSIGTVLAIVGSTIAGLALTRQAVRPIARAFAMLRDFTADASHELRSPLTAIAGNADAALRDPCRDPMRDYSRFASIADAAKQMSYLTNDLLLLASADQPLEREMFVIDVVQVVEKLAAHYRPRFANAGITFSVTTDGAAIAYGNPDQVERILVNLLENALHYTLSGGAVSIATGRERSRTIVTVRDTGVGIAEEHLDRIFDRFWRLDPARLHDGTGLGLAIVRALARRHGGDVRVTSRLGMGSEFTVSFPTRPSSLVEP